MTLCEPCQAFCGRKICSEDNSTTQGCGPCPWGWQNTTINLSECSICSPCSDQVDLYDWLFFAFIMFSVYGIHFQAIIRLSVGNLRFMIYEMLSAFIEVYLGFFVTVLSYSPRGSLYLTSCYTSMQVNLEKWYPFAESTRRISYELATSSDIDYEESCLYEVVYPRLTLPLFSMMLSILLTLFGRPAFIYLSRKFVKEKPMEPYLFSPYLEALHRLPYAILFYFISCGVLYVSFPYVVLIVSVISLSAYIAAIQSIRNGKITKHVPFIYLNLLSMLFGLGALIYANSFSFWFLFLSAFPALFFFSTEKISDLHAMRAEMAYTIVE